MKTLLADADAIDARAVAPSALRTSAALGAIGWLFLVLRAASTGVLEDINRFLLLAVLVVVPTGLSLCGRALPRDALARVGRLQPIAALFAVASFALNPGGLAALLAAAWLVFAVATAHSTTRALAAMAIARGNLPARCFTIATVYLAVGAAWLTAARLGIEPLGFAEPFVSLTAVHFHYAGFATSAIAGALTLRIAKASRATILIVTAVLGGPPAVAVGFLISPLARVLAVACFAAGVVGLAALLLRQAIVEARLLPRILLATSGSSVLFSISFAVGYALSEWLGGTYFTIPRMVALHGWANALGFALPGLLGCAIARGRRD
jgi:hypothetical protein